MPASHTPDPSGIPDPLDVAADAVSEEERTAFRERADADQRAEADLARNLYARWGEHVMEEEPSPGLKERVMETVRRTPQQAPESPVRTDTTESRHARSSVAPGKAVPEKDDASSAPIPLSRARHRRAAQRSRRLTPSRVLAAACAAGMIVLGGWGLGEHRQLEETRGEITAMRAEARDQGQASLVDQISMASDVSLAKGRMDGADVSVVYSPSHGMAGVATTDLPRLPEDKAYMIWFYDAQGRVVGSASLKNSSRSADGGSAVMDAMQGMDLTKVTAFGLTVEDASATRPSTKPTMLETMS